MNYPYPALRINPCWYNLCFYLETEAGKRREKTTELTEDSGDREEREEE
jgi:hypothetical protein